MKEQIIAFITLISTAVMPVASSVEPMVSPLPETQVLAEHELDLTTREPNPYANEVFAFHGNVLPEFANPSVTTNSRFFIEEGYKSVAGLGGNGVCHLASLINWTASEAGLEVLALANHNFALVPGVPKEYGTSIRSQNKNQNLYIKNNFNFPVTFEFKVDDQMVVLMIYFRK
jgi:hypothetical protein